MPGLLISKKKTQESQPSVQYPAMDKQAQMILDITRIVLLQMQAEFGRMRYPTFEHYVAIKPPRMAADMNKFDEEEDRAVENYTIQSMDQLLDMDSWRFYKDPKGANDDRYLHWPSKHEFETVVDQQRQALFMNNVRRKNREMRVPAAGYRMIWATKYAEWAAENLEKATEEWENSIVRGIEKKGDVEVTKDDPDSSNTESEYSDDLDDDLMYPKVLGEIKCSANRPSDPGPGPDDPQCHAPDEPVPETSSSFESFVADISPGTSSPISPTFSYESPEEARRRRRRTAFNMGFINARPVPGETQCVTREVTTIPKDKLDWEEQLKTGLAKEKDRQRKERRVISGDLEEVAEEDEEGF
jgi:hypothetical protein